MNKVTSKFKEMTMSRKEKERKEIQVVFNEQSPTSPFQNPHPINHLEQFSPGKEDVESADKANKQMMMGAELTKLKLREWGFKGTISIAIQLGIIELRCSISKENQTETIEELELNVGQLETGMSQEFQVGNIEDTKNLNENEAEDIEEASQGFGSWLKNKLSGLLDKVMRSISHTGRRLKKSGISGSVGGSLTLSYFNFGLEIGVDVEISSLSTELEDDCKPGDGYLAIYLLSGQNLPAKDRGGTSDPYVEFKIGGNKIKSRVINKNLNPVWNEYLKIDCNINDILLVKVYDHNKILMEAKMGQQYFPLKKMGFSNGQTVDCTVQEGLESGVIYFKAVFKYYKSAANLSLLGHSPSLPSNNNKTSNQNTTLSLPSNNNKTSNQNTTSSLPSNINSSVSSNIEISPNCHFRISQAAKQNEKNLNDLQKWIELRWPKDSPISIGIEWNTWALSNKLQEKYKPAEYTEISNRAVYHLEQYIKSYGFNYLTEKNISSQPVPLDFLAKHIQIIFFRYKISSDPSESRSRVTIQGGICLLEIDLEQYNDLDYNMKDNILKALDNLPNTPVSADPQWLAPFLTSNILTTSPNPSTPSNTCPPSHPPSSLGSTPSSCSQSPTNSGNSQNQFGQPQNQFGQPQNQFGQSQNQFGQPQNQFGNPQNQFGNIPENQFGNSQNQFGPPQNQFGNIPENQFGNPQNQFGNPQNQFGNSQNQFGNSQNQFGNPQNQFGLPPQGGL